ncbi:hypothetical protein K438DRAFT_1987344 [Mycena galopus ATCC 62051]|nr:hypothetical protein K438DRAFT_1987344 [Mycena galopus ATCC 62051]
MRNQQEQAKKQEERADNDRLLQALQTGFSDLVRNQQKQAKKQEEQTERLQQAVEALKPKPPATDKKTEFWNAYKTLADEYDKEINDRYGSDLNTDLVFAGLFSAVDSAFIIQIQPELQPNGTAIIVIAQSLLYLSLGMTLLAALLAVLAMQWLMYYSAANQAQYLTAHSRRHHPKFLLSPGY